MNGNVALLELLGFSISQRHSEYIIVSSKRSQAKVTEY